MSTIKLLGYWGSIRELWRKSVIFRPFAAFSVLAYGCFFAISFLAVIAFVAGVVVGDFNVQVLFIVFHFPIFVLVMNVVQSWAAQPHIFDKYVEQA